jgi:nucleotide-binding universal stress UspA family protein
MSNNCASYDRIMVPLDLSSYSDATFSHAVALARAFKAELLILNVVNSRGLDALDHLAAEGFAVSREKYVETVKADRQAQFDKEFLSQLSDVKIRVAFRVGLPYEEIVKAVVEEKVSVVVMGTKGRTNLTGTLFGTTAEKVFRRSPCPVFSVRGPEHCRLP